MRPGATMTTPVSLSTFRPRTTPLAEKSICNTTLLVISTSYLEIGGTIFPKGTVSTGQSFRDGLADCEYVLSANRAKAIALLTVGPQGVSGVLAWFRRHCPDPDKRPAYRGSITSHSGERVGSWRGGCLLKALAIMERDCRWADDTSSTPNCGSM